MKTIAMTLTLLAGLPLAASAQVTKEDLKKLSAAGISDDVIVSYMRSNGPVVKLSADDIIELKQAGASERVISSALGNLPAAPAPAPSYTPPAASRNYDTTYYLPASTSYVYDGYPAYSTSLYVGGYYPYYGYGACYPRYYGGAGYCNTYYRGGYSGYCAPRGYLGVSAYSGGHVGVSAGYSTGRVGVAAGYSGGRGAVGGYIRR